MIYLTDRDIASGRAYAEHLRSTVVWAPGTVVTWPNWANERATIHQVAAEHGFTVRVRNGKGTLTQA
jgi:hypothetical protein